MIFNEHSNLVGQHAFLGASKYHWLNYDEETLINRFRLQNQATIGTILHNLASLCIKNHIKLSKTNDKHMVTLELLRNGISGDSFSSSTILETLAPFVNDAIAFGMRSEQVLYYSENCFGTTDAISYKDGILRIHDYKSGTMPAHMEQLMIYAGIFCLEYKINPYDILETELRIYQNAEILYHKPEAREIEDITKRIIEANNIIEKISCKEVVI